MKRLFHEKPAQEHSGKTRGGSGSALAVSLLVSGLALAACDRSSGFPEPQPPSPRPLMAAARPPASVKRAAALPAPGNSDACDVEFTQAELKRFTYGLRRYCHSPSSTVVPTGGYVSTKSGVEMGIVRKDREGATIAFGAKGSYLVTTYVPFDTITTLMVPPMKRGREDDKVKSLDEDALILICPAVAQPADGLRLVSRVWRSIKCDISRRRNLDEMQKLKRKLDELKQKLKREEEQLKQQERQKDRDREYEWRRIPDNGRIA